MNSRYHMPEVIVTRHQGMLDWLCSMNGLDRVKDEKGGEFLWILSRSTTNGDYLVIASGYPQEMRIKVLSHVTADDIRGKHVLGVLPVSLARYTRSITEVEMPNLKIEQRGKELTPEEMNAAGAKIGKSLRVTEY